MKFLCKEILIASLALCITSAAAFAEETSEPPRSEKENIKFNYQTNVFDIDAGIGAQTDVELTVMLVKGDYVSGDFDFTQISAEDIYYIGQEKGKDYDVFDGLGVKYDTNAFAPGVYTLITSGEQVELKKTKLVIGNAINKDNTIGEYLPDGWDSAAYTFGSVSQTVRYYPENENYIYVCYADFSSIKDRSKAGFVFQNISNTKGTAPKHLVKTLEDFNVNTGLLDGIAATNAHINIAVQVNDIPAETIDNIVAIPYVEN